MILKLLAVIIVTVVLICMALLWLWRPVSATHPALQSSPMLDAIPLRDFYANTEAKSGWSLSIDGKKLTWLETSWFKPILRIKNLESGEITSIRPPEGFLSYMWAADERTVLFTVDVKGTENQKIAAIDTSDADATLQTFEFGENAVAFPFHIPRQKSDEILIAHNGENPARFKIYRLNVETGQTRNFGEQLEHQVVYALDHESRILGRAVYEDARGSGWRFEVPKEGKSWRKISEGALFDQLILSDQASEDGSIFALSNLGRDKTALVKLDLSTGQETIILSDPDVDLNRVIIDPKTNELLMATAYPGYQKRYFLNDEFEREMEALDTPKNASLHVLSRPIVSSRSLIQVETPEAGFETRLVNRDTGTTETISVPPIAKHRDKFSPVEPVFIKASDGLDIPAFLSRPKGVDGPAPMVILIHGGPIAQSAWGYNGFRNHLNNRGYAVLDVNYRGSSGYGRDFLEASKGEIAGRMSEDIIDARAWAVENGIADPQNVALFGISWGGFEVMTALSQNSDLFAAGISVNGVANLSTMLDEVPDYWRGWPEWLREFVGDPTTEAGQQALLDRSPIAHASKMKTPLLLIQAANDVRVVQSQSDRMVAELEQHGAPVDYRLFKGVGHSPNTWPWQKRYLLMRDIEYFLAEHLGGRTGGYDYVLIGAHVLP